MALTASGLGSGLDVNGMVSQLMAVERRPISALDQKEAQIQAKISAYGSVKGAISAFQAAVAALAAPARFAAVKASIADASVASAAASSAAVAGTYSIEVSKLAQAQKLASAGQASSTAAIGTGTLTFDFGTISGGSFDAATGKYTGAGFTSNGSGAKTVTIDAAHSTLDGIRDAINAANIGVTATIINDGGASPYRLALSVGATGAPNSVKLSVSGDAALQSLLGHDPAGAQSLVETVSAQNAQFKIDGLSISKPSNTATDVIQGVTLNLLKTNAGSATTLTVARDSAGVKSAVDSMVKAYNDLSKTLGDLTKFDAASKKGSVLTGDPSVRSVQSQLRAVLDSTLASAGGGLSRLADIGIGFALDGKLQLDAARLQKVIGDPNKDIATLFAAMGKATDSGVAVTGSGADTKDGSFAIGLTQLATKGKAAGSAAAGLTIAAGVNDTLALSVDGTAISVTLAAGTYTAAALATELQSRINGSSALAAASIGVSVTQSAGTLAITSNRYGSASSVVLNGGNALPDLFGVAPTSSAGTDIAGSIGGIGATGAGQTLTANGGDAKGLAVKVEAGMTGERGVVKFAKGFAYQLDKLASKLLGDDGVVDSRIDGLNGTVKDIGKRREALEARMVQIEKRYRAQFTALDTMVASMTKTSTFLSQQLANLPKANGN
jgi:flagellar hook-associated protein 2